MKNNKPFKIGIMGAHSCGKTTFSYELASKMKKMGKSVSVVLELVRFCPFELGTEESQTWLSVSQVQTELEAGIAHDVVICDRTTVDPIMYSEEQGIDAWMIRGINERWIHTYDLIILLLPNKEITYDGFRDMDSGYRERINNRFETWTNEYAHTVSNVLAYKYDDEICGEAMNTIQHTMDKKDLIEGSEEVYNG